MLIRFAVENFRCFSDEAILSMLATSDSRHPSHILASPAVKGRRILKAAGVYGANGHGKTKLIDALGFLKDLMVDQVDGKKLNVVPFRLDAEKLRKPSIFTIEFVSDGLFYEYGISVSQTHIHEEWLYAKPTTKEALIFRRVTSKLENAFSTSVQIGATMKKWMKSDSNIPPADLIDFLADGTPPTKPFLREAVERKIDALKGAFGWFKNTLIVIHADAEYRRLHTRARDESYFLKRLSEFVTAADVGIKDLKPVEIQISKQTFPDISDDVLDRLRAACEESGDTKEVSLQKGEDVYIVRMDEDGNFIGTTFSLEHQMKSGDRVSFNLDDESAGTIRLMHLVPMLANENSSSVFVVDELDRKLHPVLSKYLLDSMLRTDRGSQFIFTTHNTHLLDAELLRRDEIWFVQKKSDGSSELYSLADLRVRPDIDVEKGYFQGRFGGIPVVGDVLALGWADDGGGSNGVRSQETPT